MEAKKASQRGKRVRFVHYYWKQGCEIAPDLCLGVPYFNWAPAYRDAFEKSRAGKYVGEFSWPGVDWNDLNSDNAVVGFLPGDALPGDALGERKAELDAFVKELAGGLNLLRAYPGRSPVARRPSSGASRRCSSSPHKSGASSSRLALHPSSTTWLGPTYRGRL